MIEFRFGSPDSDEDVSTNASPPQGAQAPEMIDEQYLVPPGASASTQGYDYNKVYGAIGSSTSKPKLGFRTLLERRAPLVYHYLYPEATCQASEQSGMFVIKVVGVMYVLIIVLDLIVVCAMSQLVDGDTAAVFFLVTCLLGIILCLIAITTQPQNRLALQLLKTQNV